MVNNFQDANLEITENEKKNRKVSVRPPFITSTMQQSSSSFLGYSLKKTNKLAQDLYTGGYITYIRTDSPNISVLAQNNCKQYLLDIPIYSDILLSPRAHQRDGKLMSCLPCYNNVMNEKLVKPPRYAISNGWAIGQLPSSLDPENIEEVLTALLARVTIFGNVFFLHWGCSQSNHRSPYSFYNKS